MTRRRPAPGLPAPELPMDALDAAGGFGALAGVLSVVLPYFVGLVLALAALSVGVAVPRVSTTGSRGKPASRWALAFGLTGAGWLLFVAPVPLLANIRGLLLGSSILPLWWVARRPRAFGGI